MPLIISKGINYFAVNIYRPDDTRANISFGPVPDGMDQVAKVCSTFSEWIKLYDPIRISVCPTSRPGRRLTR